MPTRSRAFVTGATGFVGSHLVRFLVQSGDDVAVLIRPGSDTWRIADLLGRIETIGGLLADPAALTPDLARFRPDVVYHLGWSGSGSDGRNDVDRQGANVTESLELVRLAAAAGAATWIGLGSQAEFGPVDAVLDVSTATNPVTKYGEAKLAAGRLTGQMCAELSLRHVWLRLLTAYGPADRPSYLIPHLIISLLRGRKPALTEGSQAGDFLFVADACGAMRAAAMTETCAGTFVLASGDHMPVREVAEKIRDIIDPQLEIGLGELVPAQRPLGLRGNPQALRAATGWRASTPIANGLSRTVDWYRAHLARYSQEDVE